MKKAWMNISHFRSILFNLKIFGEIVTTYLKSPIQPTGSKVFSKIQSGKDNFGPIVTQSHQRSKDSFCKLFLTKSQQRV